MYKYFLKGLDRQWRYLSPIYGFHLPTFATLLAFNTKLYVLSVKDKFYDLDSHITLKHPFSLLQLLLTLLLVQAF